VDYWRSLATDDGAEFDKVVRIDAASLAPWVTWGTNPGQGAPLSARVPDPSSFDDEAARVAAELAASPHPYYLGAEAALYRSRIAALLGDRARLTSMSSAARRLARPDAARIIADKALELAEARS
jgi:homoaconitase/3-isopropylmalate dehydratase large subunit